MRQSSNPDGGEPPVRSSIASLKVVQPGTSLRSQSDRYSVIPTSIQVVAGADHSQHSTLELPPELRAAAAFPHAQAPQSPTMTKESRAYTPTHSVPPPQAVVAAPPVQFYSPPPQPEPPMSYAPPPGPQPPPYAYQPPGPSLEAFSGLTQSVTELRQGIAAVYDLIEQQSRQIDTLLLAQSGPVDEAVDIQLTALAAVPQPPTNDVRFEMGAAGTMASCYHDFIVTPIAVVLTYDNRFKFAPRYAPPAAQFNSPPWFVSAVDKDGQESKRYACVSLQLQFTIGWVDVFVLLRVVDADLQAPSGEQQSELV